MPLLRTFRSHLVPLLFLLVLWGAAFWRVLFMGGVEGQGVLFPQGDFYNHYYNFATYQVERWNAGEFPLWNPYNGAGDPFAANIQLNTFYPPRWISALVWGRDGWQIEDHMREGAIHIFITSLLTYGFVYHKTQRRGPALVGAVLWGYGGYLMSYPLQQTAVLAAATWLPLMIWGVWLAYQDDGLIWGVLLGSLGIALSLLGGHPQTTLYMLYALVAYGLFLGIRRYLTAGWRTKPLPTLLRITAPIAAMGLLGAAMSAMQLLPALEFMRLSGRLNEFTYEQKAQGFVLSDVLQIFLPGLNSAMSPLYASVGGAFLALLALVGIRSQEGLARQTPTASQPSDVGIWLVIGLFALGIGLGSQTPVYSLAYTLMPGIGFFRQPERAALIVQFALVMLAVEGYGLLSDVRRPVPTIWRMITFGFTILTLIGILITWNEASHDAWALMLVGSGLFALWVIVRSGLAQKQTVPYFEDKDTDRADRGVQIILLGLLLVVLSTDLLLHMHQSVPYIPDTAANRLALSTTIEQVRVFDPRHIRWRVDGAFGLRDDAMAGRTPNIYHAGPLAIATTEDIRHMPVDRFWEVLSVRYVTLAADQTFPETWALKPLEDGINSIGQAFRLYELPDPRPLALLVYDSRDGGGDRAFARQIMADERINLREIAVTTVPLTTPLPGTRPEHSTIQDLDFQSPESLTLTASTETNALLTLAIPRYPGWQAWVNGELVDTVEVYGGLIGIPVPAGDNQPIVLRFFSRPVVVGVLMSAGAALMWLGIAMWGMRRSH